MMHAQKQTKIGFAVRKSSRTRAKVSENDPPRRLTRAKGRLQTVECSPPKRRPTNQENENPLVPQSPRNPDKVLLSSPLKQDRAGVLANSAVHRLPLSPHKSQNILLTEQCFNSPTKTGGAATASAVATPATCPLVSPSRTRALNFSPSRTPERTPVESRVGKARSLAFSPARRSPYGQAKGGCCSPLKTATAVRASPRKRLDWALGGSEKPVSSPLAVAKKQGLSYQRVKQALHTAQPTQLLCRDAQHDTVEGFVDIHVSSGKPGSLYVSGAPGTGKTAVMSTVINKWQARSDCRVVCSNCMSLQSSQAIYNHILQALTSRKTALPARQAAQRVEKVLTTSKTMILLVLDEVDQLDSKNQEVLYTMFEWPALPACKLVLIGIANSLDLTDRILPRLQARPNCKPQLLHFPPYSREQIVAVIESRLDEVCVDGERVLEPNAVQFCARKVAALTGDMRKALDICRRAVEIVEVEARKTAVDAKSDRGVVVATRSINISHVMRVVSAQQGIQQGEPSASVPLQQKLAVCTLLLMLRHGHTKQVLMGKLHETYCKICKKQNVSSVDQSEFSSMLSLIESKGIVLVKKGKSTRIDKVSLRQDEQELARTLQDKTLMSAILDAGLPA